MTSDYNNNLNKNNEGNNSDKFYTMNHKNDNSNEKSSLGNENCTCDCKNGSSWHEYESSSHKYESSLHENRNSEHKTANHHEKSLSDDAMNNDNDERLHTPPLNDEEIKSNARWHDALKTCPGNENTITVLNCIYKNVSMGFEGVKSVLPYVKNNKFYELLESQGEKYKEFIMRAKTLAEDMGEELAPQNSFSTFWANMMIKMKLTVNSSTTKIAEMMLQGTTMGIIDMGKTLRHTPDVLPKTLDLAREVMEFEEDKVEALKHHL